MTEKTRLNPKHKFTHSLTSNMMSKPISEIKIVTLHIEQNVILWAGASRKPQVLPLAICALVSRHYSDFIFHITKKKQKKRHCKPTCPTPSPMYHQKLLFTTRYKSNNKSTIKIKGRHHKVIVICNTTKHSLLAFRDARLDAFMTKCTLIYSKAWQNKIGLLNRVSEILCVLNASYCVKWLRWGRLSCVNQTWLYEKKRHAQRVTQARSSEFTAHARTMLTGRSEIINGYVLERLCYFYLFILLLWFTKTVSHQKNCFSFKQFTGFIRVHLS